MKFLLMLGFLGTVFAVPPEFHRPIPLPDFSPEVQVNEEQLNKEQLNEVQPNEEQLNDVRVKAIEEILEVLGDSVENIDDKDITPEELINALNIIQNVVGLREEEDLNGKSEPFRPVIQEIDLGSIEVLPPRPIEDNVSNDDVEKSAADVFADDVVNVQAK